MAVAAAGPWVALVLARASGADPLDSPHRRLLNLPTLLVAPIAVLALAVGRSLPLMAFDVPLLAGALVGILLGRLFDRAVPHHRPRGPIEALLHYPFFIVYGASLAVALNGLLPQAAPSVRCVPVLAKARSGGRAPTFNLSLPALGPDLPADTWDVGAPLYGAVRVGDPVCILLHPGALGATWWEARADATLGKERHLTPAPKAD